MYGTYDKNLIICPTKKCSTTFPGMPPIEGGDSI